MKKINFRMYKELRRWIAFFSFLIINLSVLVFAFLDYNIQLIGGRPENYHFVNSLGMIVPMGLVMGALSGIIMRASYKPLSYLLSGIHRVSEGDFKERLAIRKYGPFNEIYKDFNKMVRELDNTQTLREDFINHFSHEFKTPIMSISGFADLLLKEKVSEEDKKKYLKIISEESKRLAELSKNSLLLTKLETTEIQTNRETYRLDEQIRECVIFLSPLWTAREIDLSAELTPVTIETDRELMKHVWINLLSNAIRYTPEKKTVRIVLSVSEGRCLISIMDAGIGMDEDDLSKVFNKFYKGKNMYKSAGLGLGLSIVKGILDLAGGSIEVESTPGTGSCFSVTLPGEEG